jgi:hypothetical protein
MVPPHPRPPVRLRLDALEDRLTLGDAGPLAAATMSAVGALGELEPGPGGGLPVAGRDPEKGGTTGANLGATGGDVGPGVFIGTSAGTPFEGHAAVTDDRGSNSADRSPAPTPAGSVRTGDTSLLPDSVFAAAPVAGPAGARLAASGSPTLSAAAAAAPVAARPEPRPAGGGANPFVGPLPGPDVGAAGASVTRLTARNRNTATMSGGWNPALRGILVMNDGSRWFAAETGNDIAVNSAVIYYRLGPTGWKAAGSAALPPGIQQNLATITDGRRIFSYGCTPSAVIETWFDTAHPRWNLATSNAITAGGRPIAPGPASNYVGAAWHNHTRVVWWSSVGPDGSGGRWVYAYNGGRGWNGPVVGGAGGYNSVGYVRARFDERSRLRLVGEAYLGAFPAGQRYLATATLVLGNAARWVPILPRFARSPLDLWREGDGTTHFLYRLTPTRIGYAFGPKAAAPPTVFKAVEARFISDGDRLGLVLAFKDRVEVRLVPRALAAGPIDWAAVHPVTVPLPDAFRAGGVSAIWTADDSRQPRPSDRLEFAVCGAYPARDNLIYYVTL